jgi:hypothetical protein
MSTRVTPVTAATSPPWLDEIVHTGKHGAELSLDPVKFGQEFLSNRVDGESDDILPLYKPRLRSITSETGALTAITYADADCVAGRPGPPSTRTPQLLSRVLVAQR